MVEHSLQNSEQLVFRQFVSWNYGLRRPFDDEINNYYEMNECFPANVFRYGSQKYVLMILR